MEEMGTKICSGCKKETGKQEKEDAAGWGKMLAAG